MRTRIHPWFRVLPRVRVYTTSMRPNAGCFARTTLMVLVLILIATRLRAQADTLLVNVTLVSTGESTMVDAIMQQDSTLQLPAAPVHQLLGLGQPTTQWITPHEIEVAYQSVRVVFSPRELRVFIYDPLNTLPASRAAQSQLLTQLQRAPSMPVQSGAFASLAVDDSSRSLLDVGYSWRGRIAVAGRADNSRATALALTFVPSSHLFLTYQKAAQGPPNVTGRVSAGPFWLFSSYSPHTQRPLDVSGLLRVGPTSLYASRDVASVTLSPTALWSFQVAHREGVQRATAARVSVGPWALISPFAFPATQLVPRR